MPQVQDWLLDLLTSSTAHYHCATAAPSINSKYNNGIRVLVMILYHKTIPDYETDSGWKLKETTQYKESYDK